MRHVQDEGEMAMRRALLFLTVAVLAVFASGLLAQSDPFVGTWKLNPAKSKFAPGAPAKEVTFTFQMVGDQATVTGTAPDGSPFKYEVPLKGGIGKFLTGPFEGVSAKRVKDNTLETSYMKGGKEMLHVRSVVSKDGKSITDTAKGTDAQGKPVSGVAVWEKQ
jgi:hypothetical protein